MAEGTDLDALARSIGQRYGVTPVPGIRVNADDLVLPLVGRRLSMVAIAEGSWYIRLHFWGIPDFVLEVEGPGSVTPSSSGNPIAPQSGPYSEIIGLVGQEIVAACATPVGGLHLAFGEGTLLDVDPPHEYETWQLRDEENAYLVVSDPGGGIIQFGEPDASVPRWTPVPAGPLASAREMLRRVLGR